MRNEVCMSDIETPILAQKCICSPYEVCGVYSLKMMQKSQFFIEKIRW